tara:strand:- start:2174 stop:2653 length:480 start_codon:yes stop_codon:yes gene_type:complete
MAQQGFNPFAPQMPQQQQPQMKGIQAPNVAMQSKPGLMETIGPAVASEAMGSEAAGDLGGYLGKTAKDTWGSLTGAGGPSAAALADAAVVTSQAPTALMGTAGTAALGGAEAAIASQAATAAATTAAGTAAGAAPLALMAGPFAPLVLGGMMVAANSGK